MENMFDVNDVNNGSFKLNIRSTDLVQKDVLSFSDGDYVVTKVYKFKKIRMFLANLGFKISFYEIKRLKNGK